MIKRLTKAEKSEIARAVNELDNSLAWKKFSKTYTERLINIVSRAEKLNFFVQYSCGVLKVKDFGDFAALKFPILLKNDVQDFDIKCDLDELLWSVEEKEVAQKESEAKDELERKESEAKDELKQTALRKLTDEEKEALGF